MPRKKAQPLLESPAPPSRQEVHAPPHQSYMTRREQDPSLPLAIVVQTQYFHQRRGKGEPVSEEAILESLGQSHLTGIPMHFRAIDPPFIVCLDEAALQSALLEGSQ